MGPELWIDLVSYAAAGVTTVVVAIRHLRSVNRRVHKERRVAISQLAEDTRGRIEGHVKLLEPMIEAALTGRPCVFYRAQVETSVGGERGPAGLDRLR